MRVSHHRDVEHDAQAFTLYLDRTDANDFQRVVIERAIQMTAEHIASVWLEEHQQEFLAKLDPQAIANMAVAAAGGAVREMLGKKLPDVVQHHHHEERTTEVYQRGIFGGLRRLR